MTARRGAALGLLLLAGAALAQPSVDVYLFWRLGCPSCEQAIAFLDAQAAANPAIRLHKLEISRSEANAALMVRVAGRFRVEAGPLPLLVAGDRVWVDYLDDAVTGAALKAKIDSCLAHGCPDPVRVLAAPARAAPMLPHALAVPLLGEVRTASLSLPVLTAALAAVDGFNPCTLWVLVFLLALLAGIGERTRMWALGGTFVAASAVAHLLVLTAWLNLLLFVGAIVRVRIAVGLVALAIGGWYLRPFFQGRAAVCELSAPERRQRLLARRKALFRERKFLLALAGVVLLALAVNLVQFLCSSGIPAVFAQVLALADLAAWRHAAYLLLYMLVFMADDLVVLFAALWTLQASGLTTAYARCSSLCAGLVLIAIGAMLIGRPQWLALG